MLKCIRATITNRIAGMAPRFYIRMTHQTGRGESAQERPEEVVDYFLRCYVDYMEALGIAREEESTWLSGKTVLEYGPGDVPGVALLMVANGATKVFCVDRFPMLALTPKNIRTIELLLEACEPDQRSRMQECFVRDGEPASGWNAARIEYLVEQRGLSHLDGVVDVAISRAVLEHVNDLAATFADIDRSLKPGGVSVHLVDLKSHGLHDREPLDFLTWPDWLWNIMYSNKGVPNRLRADRYRAAIELTGLVVRSMTPTTRAERSEVESIRPRLARAFRAVSDEDLAWLGFWVVLEKPL